MKYAKILGLLAVAAAALMAFVGSASATTLTEGTEKTKVKNGTIIEGKSVGNTVLDGSVNITCEHSTVKGEVTQEGSETTTVKGGISSLTFEKCGTTTITVINGGTLEVHTKNKTADNTGTVTSSGAHVTIQTHSFFLGTTHCIYATNNTHIGELTGSDHGPAPTHTTATLHITSAPIPQTVTDGLCGNDAEWTGTYEITKPDHLYVD